MTDTRPGKHTKLYDLKCFTEKIGQARNHLVATPHPLPRGRRKLCGQMRGTESEGAKAWDISQTPTIQKSGAHG